MPFIGLDWRSPGEEWVKTDEGWERKKLLERLTRARRESFDLDEAIRAATSDVENRSREDFSDSQEIQPFCPITLKCTREIAGFNGLSEAFQRLDFRNAVRDIRRFNYICKLLHLLITQNLTTLSGCAQRVLFTMLEEVAYQVSHNQTNLHILRKLLADLRKTLIEHYCWGRPLGSTVLWEHHQQTIDRIVGMANCIEIKKQAETFPKLEDLPEEIVREILLRLADPRDLQSSGEAYNVMDGILDEQHLWKQLCKFHFTSQQVSYVMNEHGEHQGYLDWQVIFHKLKRRYGLKEDYPETLQLCRQCRCLFWKSFGHPCLIDESSNIEDPEKAEKSSLHVTISPQAFLKFFSL